MYTLFHQYAYFIGKRLFNPCFAFPFRERETSNSLEIKDYHAAIEQLKKVLKCYMGSLKVFMSIFQNEDRKKNPSFHFRLL